MFRHVLPWALVGAVLASVSAIGLSSMTVSTSAPLGERPRQVILVTLDTTRADALGAWGGPSTPTLDRLAAEGTRYANALTPSPLTLPAHASLLTGRDTIGHGLRRNGAGTLAPEIPTIAEAVRRQGWTTAAFVASLVLDRRHGLDRGFDHYDDSLVAEHAGQYGIPERDAETVTDLALEWLAARRPDQGFLLWVHYFDPHAPYDAPGDTDAERYLGEVARVDRELGRLVAALPPHHLLVVVGDHGESLGQRGERFHGLALHTPTLHVPLLLEGAGVAAATVVPTTVSTARVAATIAVLAGFDDGSFGPPLPGLAAPPEGHEEPADLPVLSETLLPLDLYGWAPLAAVTSERTRYLAAPRPQLFDLAEDPAEARNLAGERPQAAARLAALVAGWWQPPTAGEDLPTVDAAQQAALEALGYATATGAPGDGTDPSEGLALLARLEHADRLVEGGRLTEAVAVLEDVLVRNPSNPAAWARLAAARGAAGDADTAVDAARRAAALRPSSVLLGMRLADTLRGAGRPAAAASAYERVVELDPRWAPAWFALADLAAARGDADGERTILRRAVAADSVALLSRLARREATSAPPSDPTPWLERAQELDPTAPEPWLVRGDLALADNRPQEAETAFTRAAALDPTRAEAALGLGRALMAAGEAGRARPHLVRASVLGRGTPIEREAQEALESLSPRAAIENAESH